MTRRLVLGVAAAVLVAACGGAPSAVSSAPDASSTRPPAATADVSPPATVAPPAKATPIPLGDRPWVAFQTDGANGYGVYLLPPEGGAIRPGTNGRLAGWQEHPDWSPDGSRFLFTLKHGDVGAGDLWIADAETGVSERVVPCESPCVWVDEASWSPDGASIAFQRLVQRGESIQSTVEVIDLATRETRLLLTMDERFVALAPRWSPDGRRMVIETIRLPEANLESAPEAGTVAVFDLADPDARHELMPWTSNANNPDWSPDGRLIVFSKPGEGGEPGGGRSDLWLIAPDGTGLRQLTNVAVDGGMAIHPTFTPDGLGVVMLYAKDGVSQGGIATVRLDGTDLRSPIRDQWVDGFHPRIRPTG